MKNKIDKQLSLQAGICTWPRWKPLPWFFNEEGIGEMGIVWLFFYVKILWVTLEFPPGIFS